MAKKKKVAMSPKIKELISFLQVAPIIFFVYGIRLFGTWEHPFEATFIGSGLAAAFVIAVLYFNKIKMQKLLLGVNCFLIAGAVVFFLNIEFLEVLYASYLNTSLFLSILVVGLISTYVSPSGFIGVESKKSKKIIMRDSWYLLISVAVAAITSFYFVGDIETGLLMPFLGIIGLRRLLLK